MNIGLDVRRAFSKSKHTKAPEDSRSYKVLDSKSTKARHILGLDVVRNSSTTSISATKLRSVTFSDATTAVVSTGTTTEVSKAEHLLKPSRKSSAVLLKSQLQTDPLVYQLKPRASDSSLRSFYDKTRTPLSVSQQTSDSSSRDFALRIGVPSVVSAPVREMEHTKQVRFFSRAHKKPPEDTNRLRSIGAQPSANSSQKTVVSSVFEARPESDEPVAPLRSVSRISVMRPQLEESKKSCSPVRHHLAAEQLYSSVRPVLDPARAKVNVRRPKAGAKNWFDCLDSDTSEEEENTVESKFQCDFPVELEGDLTVKSKTSVGNIRIDKLPSRSSSITPTNLRSITPKPTSRQQDVQAGPGRREDFDSRLMPEGTLRRPKSGRFTTADLTKQSMLCLTSSDDESEGELTPRSDREAVGRDIRYSSASTSWRDSNVQLDQFLVSGSRQSKENLLQPRNAPLGKPSIPRRRSSRPITYLDDRSSTTPTQNGDLLTSFPQIPTDASSRGTSVRESVLSENESIISTKVMTVTRQEQSLIAAMRLKKSAMKRAQAAAHRQNALDSLELDSNRGAGPQTLGVRQPDRSSTRTDSYSTLRIPYQGSHKIPRFNFQGTESVNSHQSESPRETSVRSSVATYLSEGSDDLQLPYSSIDGLPIGSTYPHRAPNEQSRRPQRDRDTFLSEMTATTAGTSSPRTHSPNARDSHVVVLDPLERQRLRDDIPSQLFMEAPFLGWEARANMQIAH